MAPASRFPLLLILVAALGLSLPGVTTPHDVRRALEEVASYQGAPEDLNTFSSPLAEKLQMLRKRARDFAFGSVAAASQSARERQGLIARARQRTKQAGLPYQARAAWMGDQFSPFVRIEYFPVPDTPDWMGARVHVGIPCGEDVSLYFWRLAEQEDSALLAPELVFARESPLTDLAGSTGSLDYALQSTEKGFAPELATIETGVWCNSQWRKAILSIVRVTNQAYRQEKLFQYQELAFVGADPSPSVERQASGYRFRYLAHFWLDPRQDSRIKELDVRVSGERAEILAPRDEDPALFLDHWIAAPWTASKSWTTGQNQESLRSWHDTLSPENRTGTLAELRGRGGCLGDPSAYYVHLQTAPGAGRQDVYGILRRREDGFRLEDIRPQLPAGCASDPSSGRKLN